MKLIIGITGASGAVLGFELLKSLCEISQKTKIETHLVITESGRLTIESETDLKPDDFFALADCHYDNDDFAAPIASGSFLTDGMVILPCSMKTLAGIAAGYSDNLLLRAADVCLKEGRRLVLAPREAPLSLVHLKNLAAAKEAGAVIVPPLMTFYHKPQTIDDLIKAHLAAILRQFGLSIADFPAWGKPVRN